MYLLEVSNEIPLIMLGTSNFMKYHTKIGRILDVNTT